MNARFLSMFRVGLTVTAVSLCGAMVLSTGAGCGGSSNGGGTGNNTGTGGAGGTGGGGGEGGGGGSTEVGGSTGCADPAANSVNFCDGKAQGAMQGYSYVSLGVLDSLDTPVCAEDPNDLTKTRPITAPDVGKCEQDGKTCPRTGHTVWNAGDKLCITGKMPKVVTPSGATSPDYKSAWGLQIGVNTGDPPAADGGKTLGDIISDAASLTMITLATEGTVTPTNSAIRIAIHTKDMGCTWNPYCATWSANGNTLASFNTQCWNGSKCSSNAKSCFSCADDTACLDNCCDALKPEDIAKIDKIGIQISADTGKEYVVDNFCLKGITFAK
jgi:hypothetical protein